MTSTKSGHFTSTKEAAIMLGCDERTIRRWIERGKLASTKQHGQRLIPLAEVERLRQQQPELANPFPDRLAAVEDRLEVLEQQMQEFTRVIQRLPFQLKNTDALTSGHHDDIWRQSAPERRGFSSDTQRLKDFARVHQMEIAELMKLHRRGEIQVQTHQTTGPSGRQEWWITPEQQVQLVRYWQEHYIPYTPCNRCAGCIEHVQQERS